MKSLLFALSLAPLALTTFAPPIPFDIGLTPGYPYGGSPNLLDDGFFPPDETPWTSDSLFWEGTGMQVTFDYGSPLLITDVNVTVDNNDHYRVSTSTDGATFTSFFDIFADLGDVPVFPGGQDTFSTDPSNPNFLPSLDVDPRLGRYVRIEAVDGDGLYSVGELEISGRPVPEAGPLLSAAALVGMTVFGKRRRK